MKLIAETAMHHEGDFNYLKSLILSILDNKISDYVKLHLLLDIDEYFLPDHPGYQTTKSWLFSKEQWNELINLILTNKNKPLFLYNDSKAVEFGNGFNPEIIEIHSVCLNDTYLLDSIKKNINSNTKIVIGVGGCSINEIDHALNYINHPNTILMFGFQNYPTNFADVNFRKIRKIMSMYPQLEFGYADHTAWNHPENILITLFGASLGMNYLEKHVTNSFGEQRTDGSAAISIDMMKLLKSKIEILAQCNGDGKLDLNEGEQKYSVFGPMKKAPILAKDVSQGSIIFRSDFSFKRTNQQTDLSQTEILSHIGKKYRKDLKAGKCITRNDLED